jgi:hypothetical protein
MGSELPVPQKVTEYAAGRETISLEEVMRDLNVSRITAKNYLSRLAKMDVVKRIGRGLYQVGKGDTATVRLSPELLRIAQEVRERFPMARFIVWSMSMLADYAHYAVGRDLVVLESDRVLSASVRDVLLEKGYRAVLNPEKRDFREYALFGGKTVFVLERSEKYGLAEVDGVLIPTVERVWLDVYYFVTRKELSFSPAELGLIFANMLRKGGVNFSRFLRYAQRRNLRDEMIIFLYRLKKSSQLFIPDSLLVGKRETLGTIDEMVEGTRD